MSSGPHGPIFLLGFPIGRGLHNSVYICISCSICIGPKAFKAQVEPTTAFLYPWCAITPGNGFSRTGVEALFTGIGEKREL